MRKLIFQMTLSLDGYYKGLDEDISWHAVDAEFQEYANQALESSDGMIFGRRIYELMAAFWPTEEALRDDPVTAGYMNSLHKYVISRSLKTVTWENSTVLKGDPVKEITRLKEQPGKDLGIGGSDIIVALNLAGLIDEYRILYAPILLGKGKTLFEGLAQPIKLKLIESRVFKSGVVANRYAADK
jgi:dihydrofolate reductase